MHILLLSANTGEGHNSTAKAIVDVLEMQGAKCDTRDALAFLSPRFSKFVCNWHARLYKYGPKLFDAGYRVLERTGPSPDETTPIYELLSLGAGKLWDVLADGDYDAVICVHPFSGMMMTEVRRVWNNKVPCFFVATDYTCSPTVEQCEMDGYFIPAYSLIDEFVYAGLPKEKLIPSGIPVQQGFYRIQEKEIVRQQLNLPLEGLIVLLMCGSMGCGPMQKIAKEMLQHLPKEALVVAVCGKNERLYESLSEIEDPRIRVLGFTREISSYMDAVDIIVTKPGGLSTTEAANKHLPMVLINSVGGCEGRNFEFFLKRGFALGSSDPRETVQWTAELAKNPERRQQMAWKLESSFQVNSAREIAVQVLEAATLHRKKTNCIGQDESGHSSARKEGCNVEKKHDLTVINLARAFAGEAQARMRYHVYADVARKEGKEWIARIFAETEENEAIHAQRFLEMLQRLGGCASNIDLNAGYPFELGNTLENLEYASSGERYEHDVAYPEFAEIARREGHDDVARLWLQIARIEGVHHNVFSQLYYQMKEETLTEKAEPIAWRCLNCGYTYEGIRACNPCPVCGKDEGWQEGSLEKKQMKPK